MLVFAEIICKTIENEKNMIIQGHYNRAVVYTEKIEESAAAQIKAMCDSDIFSESKIRIMPDVHAGSSCTIGTTVTVKDKIVPNMVGVDIGCGMDTVQLYEKNIDLPTLDKLIYECIPAGCNHRKTPHEYAGQANIKELRCYRYINEDLALKSIGTLGGGNHFIETDKDEDGNLYLVVHSGSRHLGNEVATYYQTEAYRQMSGNAKYQIDEMIRSLKAQGRNTEIQSAVAERKSCFANISPDMAYVSEELFENYIHDMKLIQAFAVLNRRAMIDIIVNGLGLHSVDSFTTIHNYIDTENMILRKGAVSAQRGEKLLIPINMRDGSLICIGKGNAEWNCSAPHGAGRLLSRGNARATLSLEDFEEQMRGIYTTSVNRSTLDESPMAYKSLSDIVDNITPTVDIVKRIVPIYNFKASDEVD